MIQKIKSLFEIEEKITEINSKINDNNIKINELKSNIEDFKNKFSEVKTAQDELLKNLKDNVDLIKNTRSDFEKELYEFNLIKSQTQRKILEKFEEELQKDLQLNREKLSSDVNYYLEMRKKLDGVITNVALTKDEITKLLDISRSIKKEDFELTKFARHLIEMDRDKLELMRKIDSLERLVSKMRRINR